MSKEYVCVNCDKELSKSGYYKHIKWCGVDDEVSTVADEVSNGGELVGDSSASVTVTDEGGSSPPTSTIEESDDTTPEWMQYEPVIEENVTERMPTPLKFVEKLSTAKPKKKYSVKELKEIQKANVAILKMGLGATDFLITKYGQAVTENKEYECSHSDNDKTMVANSQNAWLEESGVNLSQHFSKGKIALVMTGYYLVPPVLKIQKQKTKSLIRKGIFKNVFATLTFKKFRDRRRAKTDEPQPLE
jgi:hypothetical protein